MVHDYFPAMPTLKFALRDEGIALVTLANPPMNTMDAGLLEELAVLFEGLAADSAVRAAVIVGRAAPSRQGLISRACPRLIV